MPDHTPRFDSIDYSKPAADAWFAYGAAVWAFVFAVLHAVWAAGWYVGLPEEQARAAFQRTWFLVYDLVIAGLCALAGLVALALMRPWEKRMHRVVSVLAWAGTGLLVVRAGGSIAQTVYLLGKGRFVVNAWTPWELWFYLGAILFGLSLWRFQRAARA